MSGVKGYIAKEFTEEMARDILCTAVEGGVSYWMDEDCTDIDIEKSEKFGDESVDMNEWYYISVSFTYEGKRYKVHTDDLIKNAEAFSKKYSNTKYSPMYIDDSHDSESADAFFQFSAFNGKIIFG